MTKQLRCTTSQWQKKNVIATALPSLQAGEAIFRLSLVRALQANNHTTYTTGQNTLPHNIIMRSKDNSFIRKKLFRVLQDMFNFIGTNTS